ncbi:unnamed protein product [Protopolystoma xenopodis]|uniref:Uncharacterized protein n=1 Tax=Protopolystoma xenopodis TaxID=117903 RepID=A0A448WIX9_9PLAT|nr:unnamed protein product [Protopolystoma xenopodis]
MRPEAVATCLLASSASPAQSLRRVSRHGARCLGVSLCLRVSAYLPQCPCPPVPLSLSSSVRRTLPDQSRRVARLDYSSSSFRGGQAILAHASPTCLSRCARQPRPLCPPRRAPSSLGPLATCHLLLSPPPIVTGPSGGPDSVAMAPARTLNLRGGSMSPSRQCEASVLKVGGDLYDEAGYRMDVTVWFRHRNEVLYCESPYSFTIPIAHTHTRTHAHTHSGDTTRKGANSPFACLTSNWALATPPASAEAARRATAGVACRGHRSTRKPSEGALSGLF